jgi:DnaD/phage-associated family protein
MHKFHGFAPGPARLINVPAQFFAELLPIIDDLDELKLTLLCIWALGQKEGDYRYLRRADLTGTTARAMHGLDDDAFEAALARALARGTLLRAEVLVGATRETLYFANTTNGRAATRQIENGAWLPGDSANPVQILPERPTVYRLYEENIGPLTPLIADDLKDAEAEFGYDWLAEAVEISVRMEKRSMAYIRAILERWRKEGKIRETSGRFAEEHGERYVNGEFSDFIKR